MPRTLRADERDRIVQLPDVVTGLLDRTWPFAKIGKGDRVLVVFPGIHDALQDVTISPKLAAWFCGALGAAPSLVIGGMDDALMPPSALRELAERIPCATLRLFERAGHGVIEERKEDFERAIIEFLDEKEPIAEQDRPILRNELRTRSQK